MKKRIKEKKKQENGWFPAFDIFIPIVIILSLINPIRAALTQYYILEYPDDVVWVYYAQVHFNNISGLLTDKMGTGFRPVISVLYYIGYTLWGSNQAYYYLMNGAFFSGAMVFLYLLIKMLHSRTAGMIAVLLYLFLDSSFILISKMNFTTTIAEMFFIMASLYCSIHYFEKKDRLSLAGAIVLGILAFFSKEQSMVIIPAVNIIYLLHKKELGTKTRVIAIAVNILPLVLLYIVTAYIASEVSVSAGMSERVKENMVFYVQQELIWQLKNPYIFFLGIIGTFYFRKFGKDEYGGIPIDVIKNIVSISLIAFVYFAGEMLYSFTGGIIILLLLALGFVLGNHIQRIGIAWFGVSFVPLLLTSQPVQPTYLAEPNLGMALLLGVTLSEYVKYIYPGDRQKNSVARTLNYANIALLVLIVILQVSVVPGQISNTNSYHNMVVQTQANFKGAVDYITSSVPKNGTIYYISTDKRQQTGGRQMDSSDLHWFLCVMERCDIHVLLLESIDKNTENKDRIIFLPSDLDVYIFVNNYKDMMDRVNVLKEFKNGDHVAYILKMKN